MEALESLDSIGQERCLVVLLGTLKYSSPPVEKKGIIPLHHADAQLNRTTNDYYKAPVHTSITKTMIQRTCLEL